jgi:20S proteasome subunit beta 5
MNFAISSRVRMERRRKSWTSKQVLLGLLLGTTTLAFVFQGGVIMAVDSRATMGNFISSETVRKVIEISPRKLATIAGGAADCQYWEAWLAQEVRMFELRHGKEPSVAASSRMMVNLINHYKRYGLSMGLMLSGVDESGPHLYYINTEGSRIKGNIFSVGSGMTFAYGVLDTFYRYDLSL